MADAFTTVRTVAALRARVRDWREKRLRVAFVPTMGALHQGHLALVKAALGQADRVVASIFVNPKQFGPAEDLARYPRQEREDATALEAAGCHVLFAPPGDEMYPVGFATEVRVTGLTEDLCGASRPGHFDGVATVVTKLLNQVRADVALFGEKDYQQLLVVKRLAADLDIGTEIVGVPTVREANGLALSSRNAYLGEAERSRAAKLPQVLFAAREALQAGSGIDEVLASARRELAEARLDPEYVELRDAQDLGPARAERPARLLAAVRVGTTRLIDNIPVE